jgi:uroporphyrinogen-III decarboxylase
MEWVSKLNVIGDTIKATGYPSISGGFTKAPFDVIGDTLRGTKEIMMDLFRRPDLVVEACERLTPIMIKAGVHICDTSGHPLCFIPLHKGADGFMSHDQFQKFYWPSLRKVAIGLIDEGVVPLLFAEGEYNSRLETIADLPKGKAIWFFDRTDIKKAKDILGDTSCIMGNFPLDLLYAGTAEEVRTYAKELIDTAGKGGGYIFASGAGLQGTKPENVKIMIDFFKEHGVYR